MTHISTKYKNSLVSILLEAGSYALKEYQVFERKSAKMKSKREIVTKVDLKSEKIIISGLKNQFPDTGFISEEAGTKKASRDYVWIIDPIDGTTNFSIHNPLWAISVGLACKNTIILGVIYAPALGELYVAEKGQGAYYRKVNNSKLSAKKRLKVSQIPNEKVLNTFCHGSTKKDLLVALKYYRKQKLNGFDCRQLGSASLELAYVASGRVESIMIPGAHSYDVAAGALIVKEAGGRVTDFKGNKWQLSSSDILATNNKVHRELLGVINN
jgi:myo-inositol-1(or 4)-monophosphatase